MLSKYVTIRKLASQMNVHDFVEMMDMINSEGLARDKIKSESRLLVICL